MNFTKKYIYLLLLYFTFSAAETRFRFDYNYYPEAAGWFKLHLVPANWTEARLRCDLEEYHLDTRTGSCYKFHRIGHTWSRAYMTCAAEGGYLTIINSEVESQVLKELYAKFPNDVIKSSYSDAVFIGLYDWSDDNTWRTVHGKTLQASGFEKWNPGEPNNGGNNEHCGTMFRTGLLNDAPCNINLAYICEKSPTSIIYGSQQGQW